MHHYALLWALVWLALYCIHPPGMHGLQGRCKHVLSLATLQRCASLCRFVCRKRLGEKSGDAAACLTPIPAGSVVYGSGDAAIILTKVRRSRHIQAEAASLTVCVHACMHDM